MDTLVKLRNNIFSAPARVVFTQNDEKQCTLTVVVRCDSRLQTTSDVGIDDIDSLITKRNLNATGVTADFDGANPSILTITMTVDSKKPGTGPFSQPAVRIAKKGTAKKSAVKSAKTPAKKKVVKKELRKK